jgi:Skp family chaperone for outer membrane proteins
MVASSFPTIAAAAAARRDPNPNPNPPTTTRRQGRPAAPSRTYSEQVARLFGTERDDDDDGDDDDDSHDNSRDPSSSSANAKNAKNANANATEFEEDHTVGSDGPRTTGPPIPNPAAAGSTTTSPVNSSSRRSSAPTYASSSSSSSSSAAQQHRHSADVTAAAAAAPPRPPRPMPTNLLLRPITTSSTSTYTPNGSSKAQASTGRWKKGMGMMAGMAMVLAMAGLGWGAYRHARGQLQHELVAAVELHRALELEMAELQNEADRQLKHRTDQLKLEENLQQLNAELDDTERALQAERDKLSQRQDELERLVRAEQQQQQQTTTTTTSAAATAGKVETGGHDAYAPFDVTSPMMMGMTTNQQQQHPLQAGDATTNSEDSLVGRLVQNLGLEQYGLRPRHVELHLEYHHRHHSTTKRTSIHRRYILAQLSLLQRPITAFVFLQQVEHDLYDRVKLQIVKDVVKDIEEDEDEGEEVITLHTQLTDRQRRQRSAMGLAHVPVQEAGSSTYRNPLLAMDENGTDSGTASSSPEQQERHYHLALTDDGDLVVSSVLHRPGVFATVVHGDPVLDKLLGVPSDDAESKKGHHHQPANDVHVELISIRLLSSIDDGEEDPGHSGEEDENEKEADDDNGEEKEEEELDRHDEH